MAKKKSKTKADIKRELLGKKRDGRNGGFVSSPDPGGIILAGILYYIWTRGVTGLLQAIAVVLIVLCGIGMFGGALSLAHTYRDKLKFASGVLQIMLATALVGYVIYSATTSSVSLKDWLAAGAAFFTAKRGISEAAEARNAIAAYQ